MKYVTLNALRHNGKLYPSGKTLELDGQTALPLVVCGAIVPAAKEAKAAKPAPEVKPTPVAKKPKAKKAKGKKAQ